MGTAAIPLISTIVSFIFAITVLDQYFARRKVFQFIWAMGFFMYGIATLMEFLTGAFGLNATIYRLWFLFGAILVAAYLGMGTLYLLMKRRAANIIMIILFLLTVYSVIRVFGATIDVSGYTTLSDLKNLKVMPADVNIVTGVMNVFGTVALVGGAAWSAWVFWRKRILPHRVVSNILIALGAMMPAIGGTLLKFGSTGMILFLLLELSGAIIMFIGFLRTKEVFGFYRFPLIHGFAKVTTPEPPAPAQTK